MKAIIIAAGKGSRLKHLTTDRPKCLVEVNGKSMLQHQLDAYRANDIHDIHIVKGYMQEKIDLPDITYYINDQYEHNSILHSLMYAEEAMDDSFIATYSVLKPRTTGVSPWVKAFLTDRRSAGGEGALTFLPARP